MNNRTASIVYNYFKNICSKANLIHIGILILLFSTTQNLTAQQEMYRNIQLSGPIRDTIHPSQIVSDSNRILNGFSEQALEMVDISQLLWSCWIPNENLEYAVRSNNSLYLYVRNVVGVEPGVYKYDPDQHWLERYVSDVHPETLAETVPQYALIKEAAIVLIPFCRINNDIGKSYWQEGQRYVRWQADKLGLGMSAIRANHSNELIAAFAFPDFEFPLGLIFIGKTK